MIAQIIARLDAAKAAIGLKRVAGAAAFGHAAASNPAATPAVFVLPLDETPGEPPFSGDDLAHIHVRVGLVLVVVNVSDAAGEAAQGDLQTLRDAVKAEMLGFVPVEGYAPLTRGPSSLMAFRDGHLWWQDIYTSSYFERMP